MDNWYKTAKMMASPTNLEEALEKVIPGLSSAIERVLDGKSSSVTTRIPVEGLPYSPYSWDTTTVQVDVKPVDGESHPAFYSLETESIVINTGYGGWSRARKAGKLPSYIRMVLVHEMAHAVDPKNRIDQNKYVEEYYKKPFEFDAHCSEIEFVCRRVADKHQFGSAGFVREILSWLKSGCSTDIPYPLDTYSDAFAAWRTKPTLWRRFLQRMVWLMDEIAATEPSPVPS